MSNKTYLTEEELEEIRLKNLLGLGWEAEYAAQAGVFHKKLYKYLSRLPLNKKQKKELTNSFMKKWDENPDKTEFIINNLLSKEDFPNNKKIEIKPEKDTASGEPLATKATSKISRTTPIGSNDRKSPERLEEPTRRDTGFTNRIFGTTDFGSFKDSSPEEKEKMQKISKSLATFIRNNRKSKSFRDIVKKKDGKKKLDNFLKKIARGIMRGNIPLSVFNKMALKENSLDEIKSKLIEISAASGGVVQGYVGNKRKNK